jgi:molybdopterin-containing oxidoreductase family iron-sulfur binding subunit
MENHEVKYWKSLGELEQTPEFLKEQANEFAQDLPIDELFSEGSMGLKANRRDFLKLFGFSAAAATLACCRPICRIHQNL